jgi:hypothetical protein
MRCDANHRRLPSFLIGAFFAIGALPSSAASKTDTVIFINGDKLTGEVKSLKRGQLNLNTEATGTIGIEWDKISSIESKQRIQIETSAGIRYFGNLRRSETNAHIIVVTDNGPQTLETMSISTMTPIEGGGLHAWDVDLSVGYDFAKAGGVKHATFGVNMDFRSLIRIESLRFSTVVTDSDSQDSSKRTNLGLQHTRLWSRRWFTTTSLTFDQNDELGLNLRSSIGAGVGRYVVQSNTMLLSLEGGVQFSQEDLIAEEEDTGSLEAAFTANWDWFLFEDPELDWSTRIQLFPSLTESGRVRGELDTTLAWEIIGDLKWAFSLYGSWDNQPQSPDGASSDYGVNTALAYDF